MDNRPGGDDDEEEEGEEVDAEQEPIFRELLDRSEWAVELLPSWNAHKSRHALLARTPDRYGMLLLHHAVSRGDSLSTVQYIYGLWPRAIQHHSEFRGLPLHCLRMHEKVEVAKFLVETWPQGLRTRNDSGWLPLHSASFSSRGMRRDPVGLIRCLLETWPESVRERTFEGETPLELALFVADSNR